MIVHKKVHLDTHGHGMYLITDQVLSAMEPLPTNGMLHLLIQHTSAGLSINENCDPSVRADLNRFISELIPENWPYYTHTLEGADDMPAHIKSSLFGAQVSIPIIDGKLALGTWQGIYLCEFRASAQTRTIIGSIQQ